MASKKDKAPLQPLKGNEASEPNVKKSAKAKPAPEKQDTPTEAQPQEPQATKKVAAKKVSKAATAAPEPPVTNVTAPAESTEPIVEPIKKATKKAAPKKPAAKEDNSNVEAAPQQSSPATSAATVPAPEKKESTTAKPKKAKAAKSKTPQIAVPFDVVGESQTAEPALPSPATPQPEALLTDASTETSPKEEVIQPSLESEAATESGTFAEDAPSTTPDIQKPQEEEVTNPLDISTETTSPKEEVIQPSLESEAATESGALTEDTTPATPEIQTPQEEKAAEAPAAPAEQPVEPVAATNTSTEAIPAAEHPSVTEKNAAVAHKLAATQTHKHTKLHTIRFYLRFHTNPGQNLFITANHPLFRNGNPNEAMPMQYFNEETWTATLPIVDDFIKEPIIYNYLLQEPDGSYVYDAGTDKIIDINSYTSEEVSIVDSWNVPGYYENAFYTEPFKEVLLKQNYTQLEYATPTTFTHTFKVKAPLLAQGQVLFIAGNTEALGNWNSDKKLLLHKNEGEDFWSIELDLTNAGFSIEYKYGVYDLREDKVIQYEDGANRTFYDTIAPNKKTIVNDGFIHLPDNSWKGAGVAIPVFSLRTHQSFGVGEFTDIKKLADWAKSVGLKLIQLLPVNDTTATKTWQDSYPYAAISAFALHAMYLNLSEVVTEENKHFLQEFEAECQQLNGLPEVDYERVNDIKWKVIHHIYPLQKEAVFNSADYQDFFNNNKHWLVPYAAFCYLRDKNNTADYSRWPEYKNYDEAAINELLQNEEAKYSTGMYYFVQYHLHLQLKDATDYAHSQGIIVKGDIAIGVSRNGADTWQEPELFNMDMQAGAPPDDFAVKGQNWGFPTYNWQKMQEDDFAWWKRRFEQMSRYFDAFRIDHILGFFRIWSIPIDAIQGILGRFVPALPVHINEFHQRNIYFDYNRYVKPFINDQILNDLTGDQQWWIKDNLLNSNGDGTYSLKEEVSTQRRVETYFAIREDNAHNQWLKNTLFDLIANIILFEEKGSNGQAFHFRFGIEDTLSFKLLDEHTKRQLKDLYVNYFFQRQDDFWYHEAMKKLPALKRATNMLICGEDLGMVPATVPRVMNELGLLSLEVQRMPKNNNQQFTHIANAPYLSVVTPSTHDMSTIRGWWEEDRAVTQAFYNGELGQQGDAPQYCEPWINKLIIDQHLQSPAMWSIFQLQDLLGSDEKLRRSNPADERINEPSIPRYYWRYRMHLFLEDLMEANDFNNSLKGSIVNSKR